MPRKQLDVPAAVAHFVEDMRAFFAEPHAIKRDEIAARQLHALQAQLEKIQPMHASFKHSLKGRIDRMNPRSMRKVLGNYLPAHESRALQCTLGKLICSLSPFVDDRVSDLRRFD